MKNRIKILIENPQTGGTENVKKDFKGVVNQYNDYKKVIKQYYLLRVSYGLLLIVLLSIVYLQKGSDADTPDRIMVSQGITGPLPLKSNYPPKIIFSYDSTSMKKPKSFNKKNKTLIIPPNIKPQTAKSNPLSKPLKKEIKLNAPCEPVDGYPHLYRFFSSNFIYPQEFDSDSIEGVVKVGFTINTDGSVSNIRVLKSLGIAFDKEAVRLVKCMPKWRPAIKNGIVIPSNLIIPIRFEVGNRE
ncbi:MAG: energy transducer TonB [Bacteroidota bacterium]